MTTKHITISISERAVLRAYAAILVLGALLLCANMAHATTPNPGHPWTDVGNGNWQVANTQTSTRTYTYADEDSTVLTTFGTPQAGTIPYGDGVGSLSTTTAGTGGFVLAYLNGIPTWTATTTLANITGTLGLTQGGTNASLTASNGGIIYSTASAFAVLAGTATAGQILRSSASAAPAWSTATYPATAGTSGNILASDGTNFTSTAPDTITTVAPRSFLASGVVVAAATPTLTVFNIGLVNIPQQITVNQLTFAVAVVSTAGTMRVCVYNEAGTNLITAASGTTVAGANNVTISPAKTLPSGNYYFAIGCATSCVDTIQSWTDTSLTGFTAATLPSGKKIYTGTGTMTSGTCNASLPTITSTISKTPIFRLDN